MNCHLYDLAENTAGLFTQFLCCNKTELLRQLFLSADEADSAIAQLRKMSCTFYLSTPESFSKEDTGLSASFFVVCFQIENGMQTISGKKFEFLFSEDTGEFPNTLLIRHFSCSPVLSLCAEPYSSAVIDSSPAVTLPERIPLGDQTGFTCFPDDFNTVQEVLGSKAHKELLTSRERFSFLYAPYLYRTESGLHLTGLTLGFNHVNDPDSYQMIVSLSSFLISEGECIEEESVCLTNLAPLSANPMTPPQAAEMIKRKLSVPLAEKSASLSPEDESRIRSMTALWTKGIRSSDPTDFIQDALDRDADDLLCDVMIPKAGYEGFQEQFDMMARMKNLQPKKQGVHTLCSPYIVASDDTTATAYYLDLGWTMMGEAFGNQGDICPAMPDIGRYIFRLHKKEGQWKVFEVNWGPVIQYGMWRYDQNFYGK